MKPLLIILYKADDIDAFASYYLYYKLCYKTHRIMTYPVTDKYPNLNHIYGATIVILGLEKEIPLATDSITFSSPCIRKVYEAFYPDQYVPDWICLVERICLKKDLSYFDRLMESLLSRVSKKDLQGLDEFLGRYKHPVLMLDMIQEAEKNVMGW